MSTYEEQLSAAGIPVQEAAAKPESPEAAATVVMPVVEQLVVQSVPTWKGLLIKAFKTFIQGATAVLLASTFNFFNASAWEAAVTGGFAAVISFLNNWASAKEG